PARHQLDPRWHQHHHYHPQHACAGHDANEDAAVLLDLAHYRLHVGGGDAGARGRGDHDAHRSALRHDVLHRGGRWGPGAFSAHLLVLRASGGLHHRAAGVRRDLAGDPGVLEEAAVWVRVDGVRDGGDRDHLVHRLGAPHVYGRYAGDRAAFLHVRDHARGSA